MENIPANLISLAAFSLVMLVALLLLALKNRLSGRIIELTQKTNSQELLLLELQTQLMLTQLTSELGSIVCLQVVDEATAQWFETVY